MAGLGAFLHRRATNGARTGARRLVTVLASAAAVLVLATLPSPSATAAASHAPQDKGSKRISLDGLPSHVYIPTQRKRDDSSWNGSGWPAGIEFRPATAGSSGAKARFRFDISQLSRVAQPGKPKRGCRRSSETEVTCSAFAGSAATGGSAPLEAFPLRPAPGAKPGDRGRITVRASPVAGSSTTVKKIEVVVGEPELTIRTQAPTKPVSAGGELKVRMAVRNEGNAATEGGFAVGLQPLFTDGDTATPPHRNCASFPSQDAVECRFTHELKPGETVELETPFTFPAPKDLLYGMLDVDADPAGTGGSHSRLDAEEGESSKASNGKGPPMELRDGPRHGGGFVSADSSLHKVSFDGRTDLWAQAHTMRGEVGQTVDVPLSASADGPQVISSDLEMQDEEPWELRFTAPAGTHIVGVPEEEEESPLCEVKERRRVAVCPAMTADWGLNFSVHIDDEVPGAHGSVEMIPNPQYPPHDPDRANDTARVYIDVTGMSVVERTRRIFLAVLPYAAALAAALAAARYVVRRRRLEGSRQTGVTGPK